MHFVETRDVDINAEEEAKAVKAAAIRLHDFGFVHGDLREPNVKVSWSQGNVVHCE
jgi:tRNA A-37 threonylcarbamoyl transferase component Bud32